MLGLAVLLLGVCSTLPAPPVPRHLTEAFASPASSADPSLSPSLSSSHPFQDPVRVPVWFPC